MQTPQAIGFAGEDGWPVGVERRGWTAAEFDRAAATHHISVTERELLLGLVEMTRREALPVTGITREAFSHPALAPMFVRLARILKWGQGLLVVSGFPVRDLSRDDLWRMYWGIGSHLGVAVSQNTFGQLQGEVTVTPGIRTGRVYGTAAEAPFHADRIDILALLCVNKAKLGGDNGFVSGYAVWEAIERERPDLFRILAEGFPQDRNGEQAPGEPGPTPFRVPIFADYQGLRTCLFSGNAFLHHQRERFADQLTDRHVEALEYLRATIDRPEYALRLTLEPGEAVFINNMEMLHSRDAFEDGDTPEQKRLLLRLWLEGRPWRPKPVTMEVIRNRSGRQGIDPQPQPAGNAA
ncbi:MAG: TauD/TfdA family dioxygenase [Gammaproteobacteria bacterium]